MNGEALDDGTGGGMARPRSATASRHSLLDAAQRLFSRKGFEATSVREIGEMAGVDPALIARYFGSKAELYVAAVTAEGAADRPSRYESPGQIADALMARMDALGPGPIVQALLRADTSEEIRQAARAHLIRRMVAPLRDDMTAAGVDRAQLRAEAAVSAVIGVALGRALGWFDELAAVDRPDLVALLDVALADLFASAAR